MIIVRLKGGLGNQLFQYALGWSLARQRHDELAFDLSYYRRFHDRQPDLRDFDIPFRELTFREMLRYRAFPHTRIGDLLTKIQRRAMPDMWQPYRREEPGVDFASLRCDSKRTLFLDGYWQDNELDDGDAMALRRQLCPLPRFTDVMKRGEEILAGCDAAIHVRRGDYIANPRVAAEFGSLDVDHYRRGLAAIALGRQLRRVALFSDEPGWVVRHWDLGVELVMMHPDPARISPVVDVSLMRLATALVIANSSLSWWGAWLGERSGRTVVAPARWFAKETPRSPWISTRWIRV